MFFLVQRCVVPLRRRSFPVFPQLQESASSEAAIMKRTWLRVVLVVAGIAAGGLRADAGFHRLGHPHGVAKLTPVGFARVDGCCEPTCAAPGPRFVKEIVHEKQEVTCWKTVCEKVVEQKQIDCVRYETEKSFKEVEYTVCKPVWETRSRTVNYTVCKPVWETVTKEIPYTVCKPVYETREQCYTVCRPVYETRTKEIPYTVCKPVYETREQCYTVCKPVYETCTKEIPYTVCKPVYEERQETYTVCKPVKEVCTKEIPYTVCKPVWETRERDVCKTVCKPVHYTKTVKVCSGHWATEECEVPGPVIVKVIREPGCWTCDSCTGRRCYIPGKVCRIREQCPPRTVCKKVWVPTVSEKEVECVRWERETVVEKRCYKVCTMVREKCVKQVPVCVTRPVHYTKTIDVCRLVPKKVAYTVTRCVPKVVWREVACDPDCSADPACAAEPACGCDE